jgi:gliding motility-associated-like protein
MVFDRWGECVYETFVPNFRWDGTFNGKELPIGAYVYYIEAFDLGNHAITLQGNLSLLR